MAQNCSSDRFHFVFMSLANGLKKWHLIVEQKDAVGLKSLLHNNVVFRSPVVFKPYQGKDAAFLLLSNVLTVFEDFRYDRQFVDHEKRSCVLEFSAKIGKTSIHGVDIIEFDQDSKIVRFDVLVRPYSGATALKEAMGAKLGAKL